MHRVLIADPDRGLTRLCRRTLEGRGFMVELAADGLECLSRLRAFRPDVLVLEPGLPWGSGEGVLAVMRDGDTVPWAPVLLVTRRPEEELLQRWRDQVRGQLLKPFQPSLLVHTVQEMVGAPAVWCEAQGNFFARRAES